MVWYGLSSLFFSSPRRICNLLCFCVCTPPCLSKTNPSFCILLHIPCGLLALHAQSPCGYGDSHFLKTHFIDCRIPPPPTGCRGRQPPLHSNQKKRKKKKRTQRDNRAEPHSPNNNLHPCGCGAPADPVRV